MVLAQVITVKEIEALSTEEKSQHRNRYREQLFHVALTSPDAHVIYMSNHNFTGQMAPKELTPQEVFLLRKKALEARLDGFIAYGGTPEEAVSTIRDGHDYFKKGS